MARSSIQGAEPAPEQPAGRDTASLGPGDSSDSGSDMMGVVSSEGDDPHLPTDLALSDEQPPPPLSPDTLTTASDAAGTGESRSAGADGGRPDGWDIGVDRIITPDGDEAAAEEAEDPDLAFTEDAEMDDLLTGDEWVDEDDAASRKAR